MTKKTIGICMVERKNKHCSYGEHDEGSGLAEYFQNSNPRKQPGSGKKPDRVIHQSAKLDIKIGRGYFYSPAIDKVTDDPCEDHHRCKGDQPRPALHRRKQPLCQMVCRAVSPKTNG